MTIDIVSPRLNNTTYISIVEKDYARNDDYGPPDTAEGFRPKIGLG